MLNRVPLADTNGWWAGHDALQACPLPSLTSCIQVYAVSFSDIYLGVYNFQRWMSRFEQRWRVQRSAISIVNCRFPWADRDLNTYCAFGISLKAYVLQCLFILILNIFFVVKLFLWLAIPHILLTFVCIYFWGSVIDKTAVCRSACKYFCEWSWLCSRHCGSCCRDCVATRILSWS